MSSFLDDLRHGFRLVGRNPGLSGLAILTLALGIGASTAIFSVVNRVLFEPVPYAGSERLVMVGPPTPDGLTSHIGYLTFEDLHRDVRTFDAAAVMSYWEPALSGTDAPERLEGQRVSRQFFATLGVHPMLGRDFLPEEDRQGANHVTMLTYGFWQRRFGGDPGMVGRTITLSDNSYVVVGVLPKSFESLLAPQAELFGPLGYDASLPWACRTCQHLRMIARIRDGVTSQTALGELNRVYAGLVREHAKEYSEPALGMASLHDVLTHDVRPALLTLLGAVAFVLLIACANVINLLLGRAVGRRGELALRTALGAARRRIVRMVLGESLAMALLAGTAGVALAYAGVAWFIRVAPATLPRVSQIRVDGAVLTFSVVLTVITGLVSGIVPALLSSRADLHSLIKSGTRTMAGSRHRLRRGVVVAEVSLAVMLLSGATLLLRSLSLLLAVNPGFDSSQLLTVEVDAAGKRYAGNSAVNAVYRNLVGALGAVPGVSEVAATNMLPLSGNEDSYGVHAESHPRANPEEDPSALRYTVTPDYLKTMRIPLVAGRGLTAQDDENALPVVVVNETFARDVFAKASPLGEHIKVGGTDGPWVTIVGVVKDVHHKGLDAGREMQMYLPSVQLPDAVNGMTLILRSSVEPSSLVPAVRSAIWSVDRSLPIARVATMGDIVDTSTAERRFTLWLFELFTLLALVLSAAGIYGVLTASVAERTREIGIRSALGASRHRILSNVVRDGAALTAIGLVIGLGGALAIGGTLRRMLFGISPNDPLSLAIVVVAAGAVALLSCAIPAWRAARVDPSIALRGE